MHHDKQPIGDLSPARGCGVLALSGLALGAGLWLTGPLLMPVRDLPAASLPEALVAVAATGLVALLGWVCLTTAATVLMLAGRASWQPVRWLASAAPRGLVQAVTAACGLSLLAVGPASAATGDRLVDPRSPAAAQAAGTLDGLPLPDLVGTPAPSDPTTGAQRPSPRPPAPAAQRAERRGGGERSDAAASPARRVAVRPGDSLWALAASRLGPAATAAEVCRGWRSLYAANRGVIGGDPDLVHPGQVLRLPSLLSHPAPVRTDPRAGGAPAPDREERP